MKAFPRLALVCALFFALAANAWALTGPSVGRTSAVPAPRFAVRSAEPTTSVVVGFDSRGEAQAVKSALHLGGKNLRRSKSGGLAVVQVPLGTDVDDFVRELSTQPGVQYAEPDTIVHAAMASDDPGFPYQWGLLKIGAPSAWDVSQGSSVKVAVIDTGVDLSHPDLAGRLDATNDFDFVNGDWVAQDDNGHGTHVAGIIGATLNNGGGVAGVANLCTILPLKVMGSDGAGSSSNVAAAIRWAADHGAEVINLSLGATTGSLAVEAAVQYAVSLDCVVVAAAGNEGGTAVYYPAAGANVIGVGSTDPHDLRSSFSNYGPGVDISAPGSSIYSTLPGGSYGYMSGTSMATPQVAGVAALIRAKNPTWTRTMVERQLLGTAVDLGDVGRDDYLGYGRVRADLAVGEPVTVGVLTGMVSDDTGALAGVSVSVPDHPAVLTAVDGSYTIAGVTPFAYRVTYAKTGYASQKLGVTVLPSTTTTQNVSLGKRLFVEPATPIKTALSIPVVIGHASAKRGTRLKGTIGPVRSAPITIQVRKLVRHKWRPYRRYRVTASTAGSWRAKLRLRRGTYSIRTLTAGDSTHRAGTSRWRSVVVR